MAMNATIRTRLAAAVPIVQSHSVSGALTTAETSRSIAPVTLTVPARSKPCADRSGRPE
ncbi:hypothetical protein [Paenibacillus flagellatus]|uniref:hypothetical protein n=1 Tax=Paenibacillus flagellatus TaxID=2211139 RepID=UPI001B87B6F1|nr:hypothetical protein [Paenibacillus flagellatus]